MAPVVNPSWSLVIHMKTMHAFTAPDSVAPLTRAYRRLSYPRSAQVAEAIIINSESLRSEIKRHLEVDAAQAQADLRGGRPRAVPAGRRRRRPAPGSRPYGVTKPFVLFVSSMWPYKNCDGLLRAWALARAELGGPPAGDRRPGSATRSTAPRCTPWWPSSASATTWCSSAGSRWRRPSGSTGPRTCSCTRRSTRPSACRSSRPWPAAARS